MVTTREASHPLRRPSAVRFSFTHWKIGPFGLKDLFTVLNLLSGVAAVFFVMNDQMRDAGYAVITGFLAGDLLDGVVARRTKTSNRFGAELDTVSDHFVHVVVPGLVMYSIYQRGGHTVFGVVALALLIGSASIRHARFSAARFDFPLWCGLPRTITGFAALCFPLSSFFARRGDGYLIGLVLVAVLSAMSLMPIPYLTHRGRKLHPLMKVFVALCFLSPPFTFLVLRQYTFDVFCFWMMGFALTGWIPIGTDERTRFYAEYRRWSAELAN